MKSAEQQEAEGTWEKWLKGPACEAGAHPTVFHHQHMIGPAKWHCFCGKVERPAKSREEL